MRNSTRVYGIVGVLAWDAAVVALNSAYAVGWWAGIPALAVTVPALVVLLKRPAAAGPANAEAPRDRAPERD
ncbi:hypothetical protein ACFQ6N_08260 [Kitasatospora sp. NPDC056446]|uniref:hypothetical protein n=1 Tax=Kitasatospora sp. NPDC056446 TaxID=3345819 RepID=UPI00368BA1DE